MKSLRGFTLLELLLVLTLVAALLALGVPAYQHLIANERAATQVDQLVAAINFARSEAVKRNTIITLCKSKDGHHCQGEWRDGWIVFVDSQATGTVGSQNDILRVYGALPAKDQLVWCASRSSNYLQINSFGGVHGQDGKFIYYAQNYSQGTRAVVVSQTGRIRIENTVLHCN